MAIQKSKNPDYKPFTEIDVRHEVARLNYWFKETVKPLGSKNIKGTKLHEFQVEYAHYINDVTQVSPFMARGFIIKTKGFIRSVENWMENRAPGEK